ncbi:hypothetical protein ACQKWADRAFT_322608 [Trichoderma austrokoningii]
MLPKWATHAAGGTMASMLLVGAAFTIGHHFFYQSLSGKRPPSVVYFSGFAGGLTGQQFNLAIGSLFAFLVNSALGVVITTAANQALWVVVRTKTSKLDVVDNLATATTNIWNMFDFRLWKSSPIRMALVTIFWLLSITSFITPATLSIKWSSTKSVSMTRVPQIDFTSLNFANINSEDVIPLFTYSNPQSPVLQVVAESIVGGRILPIPSPYQNATWLLNFPGPALSCERIDTGSTLYQNISNNIFLGMSAGYGRSLCVYSFGYLSWVPEAAPDGTDLTFLPFPGTSWNTSNTSYAAPSQGVGPLNTGEPLTLLIAALPNMQSNPLGICDARDNATMPQLINMTITKCKMHNTSYVANFTYIDNIQSVELTTQGLLNNITGQEFLPSSDPLNSENGSGYNVSIVENFAYQAVMDAFGRMFVGSIAYNYLQEHQEIDTQMVLTPVLNTKEFNFLRPLSEDSSLQANAMGGGHTPKLWNGYDAEQMPDSTVSVADMIEELFRNATISLMSNSLLQPNYSSPYAPPDQNVTETTYELVYSYAAQTLWLAYGIALGMCLLSILLGTVSIYYNGGASYTTKFSTILRVAQCIDLSEPIKPEDTDGQDPTPRYIKKITAAQSSEEEQQHQDAEEQQQELDVEQQQNVEEQQQELDVEQQQESDEELGR